MKKLTTLLIFLLLNLITSYKIKNLFTSEAPTSPSQFWAKLFSVPRTTACSKAALLKQIRAEILEEREDALGAGGRRGRRSRRFYWVKQWGYGPVAYLFDFIDPIIRDMAVSEMDKLVKEIKLLPMVDLKYKDPYDFKKLISQDSTLLNSRILRMLKKFTQNYDPQVYDSSVNAVQVRQAFINWKWNGDISNPNLPAKFVKRFDMNFDGRLNPREIVLGALIHNKGMIGTQICENCFNKSSQILQAIFLYLDCNDDGWLSAEEFWGNLKNMNRGSERFNIFSFGVDENIRTAAINDFIIKNGKTKEGFITKDEFRQGVLLGLWDRQTEKTRVIVDDSRTLKTLRWRDDDTVDISLYNYYKKRIAATMP